MTATTPEDREAMIEAAAAAERAMIEAENEAEHALARAESRLARVTGEIDRLERDRAARAKRVEEARAMLTAVQKRRADGPG
jgi:chromosome segregation ATPase